MGAFAIASVLGVPAGLELARLGGWRTPFFAVSGLGLLVLVAAARLLPSFCGHLAQRNDVSLRSAWEVVRRPVVGLSLAASGAVTMSVFAIVPNIAAFLQFNAGYPRSRLGFLYFVGGLFSFFTLRVAGRLADRLGAAPVTIGGTVLFAAVLLTGFVPDVPVLPILLVFVAFMISGSFRMVPMNALATRVPRPEERARFMSMQSAVQHAASATGASLSAVLLHELPGGKLEGMHTVALLSLGLAALLPALVWAVESRVRAGEAAPTALIPSPPAA
jgi:predicted MFS family arabinose efflux permease